MSHSGLHALQISVESPAKALGACQWAEELSRPGDQGGFLCRGDHLGGLAGAHIMMDCEAEHTAVVRQVEASLRHDSRAVAGERQGVWHSVGLMLAVCPRRVPSPRRAPAPRRPPAAAEPPGSRRSCSCRGTSTAARRTAARRASPTRKRPSLPTRQPEMAHRRRARTPSPSRPRRGRPQRPWFKTGRPGRRRRRVVAPTVGPRT